MIKLFQLLRSLSAAQWTFRYVPSLLFTISVTLMGHVTYLNSHWYHNYKHRTVTTLGWSGFHMRDHLWIYRIGPTEIFWVLLLEDTDSRLPRVVVEEGHEDPTWTFLFSVKNIPHVAADKNKSHWHKHSRKFDGHKMSNCLIYSFFLT